MTKITPAPIENDTTPALALWQKSVTDALSASYAVSSLPNRNIGLGMRTFAKDGRKGGEGAGAGTGIPVWWDGSVWRTYYDNSQVMA